MPQVIETDLDEQSDYYKNQCLALAEAVNRLDDIVTTLETERDGLKHMLDAERKKSVTVKSQALKLTSNFEATQVR